MQNSNYGFICLEAVIYFPPGGGYFSTHWRVIGRGCMWFKSFLFHRNVEGNYIYWNSLGGCLQFGVPKIFVNYFSSFLSFFDNWIIVSAIICSNYF